MNHKLKELLLAFITVGSIITVFWLWFEAMPFIIAGEFEHYINLIVPLAGLIVAGTLFSLASLFIKNDLLLLGVCVLAAAVPYFFTSLTKVAIGAIFAHVLLLLLASYRIRKEFVLSLGFSVLKILKGGLPLFFTLSSLTVAIFYISMITEDNAISSLLPKPAFQATLKGISGPLLPVLGFPAADFEATIDEALTTLLKREFESQKILIDKIPRKEITRLIGSQREALSKNLNIHLRGDEKLSDVFYTAVTERLQELLGPYKKYIPYASAIAFFLAFKTLALPLYYLSLLITFLLIKFMIAFSIIKREVRTIEVEKLTL